ncbi:glycosyltransferase family 4 protein [Conexibacter sp. CPCC 206217]|uniref:glycosyltransferase family 4 protein n=1 Tax=Conexibacter sp. CPCC 206217 TaxID=3064574 RepID=UPI002726905A|nr:glycosyltransferase family 4 protein [Conexibacter sp. CPCC 206217]MDO8209219.1 glycosyltransferase family 4 protein [Conexibacter sp. CPCC 206217]
MSLLPQRRRVLMGVAFFPRGGSAHVVRGLATALPAHGWDVTVVSGSLPGHGDARQFYAPLRVHAANVAEPALQGSYEDRPDAPDRVFAALDEVDYERHVAAWARVLQRAGAAEADVLHLHHLTPLHEAAARVAPHVPVVGHLHGTELLMLEQIAAGSPPSWPHAEQWAERMRGWAARCERTIVLTERQLPRVEQLLDLPAEACVAIPNGVDPRRFAHVEVDRRAHWRRHLVERPRGWRPGAPEGSVAYDDADLAAFDGGGPVLLYVGRFTEVKRVGLLIRAFARAQRDFERRTPLVLVGGHPGEWEGEHPYDAIAASGARDVFLAGWQEHDVLPEFLAAGDAIVLPSVREQFGSVLVEGMACGLPAVAVDAMGPGEIVRDGVTGWLVGPDDETGLAQALVEVVNRPAERARRGVAAHADVVRRFSRDAAAGQVASTYAAACSVDATLSGAPVVASG